MPLTAILEQEVGTPLAAQADVAGEAAAPALALALAGIEQDSAVASDSYLRDTVVPHGGE